MNPGFAAMKCLCFAVLIVLVPAGERTDGADAPLHQQIDRLIEAGAGKFQPGASASDGEFLRRVSLDLAGRTPAAQETKQFLRDKSADKRRKLIDRLLNGPAYPRRMRELFHEILMERRADDERWTKFLETSFATNKPWDKMVREMLHPQPGGKTAEGGGFFLAARLVSEGAMADVEIPRLTRDVGRLLLGVDLQCAQCHDHLYIEDYKQRDFQGLHAFFVKIQRRRDVKYPAVSEKPTTKELEFMSVFVQEPRQTAPRIPFGPQFEIPATDKDGDIYAVKPDRRKRTPGVLKYSPLAKLADNLPKSRYFAQNIVNRMWWLMTGRGLVEPLDLAHSGNPPSHPKLLKLLAREFTARKYDLKWLLREIALSKTYQRTSVIAEPAKAPPERSFLYANEKRLNAEQFLWSVLEATGERNRIRKDKEALAAYRKKFLKAFATPPREPAVDFNPTVKAALFLLNDEQVLSLLEPRNGNLVDRLSKMNNEDAIADELYLSVLSRPANATERKEVAAYLKSHAGRRTVALGHLVWALLSSTEFCVNH